MSYRYLNNMYYTFFQVNLAVQCLSTDFSTQKGVKGMPLHIQIGKKIFIFTKIFGEILKENGWKFTN